MRIDAEDCRMRLAPLLGEAGLKLVSVVIVERSKTIRLTVLRAGGTSHRDCARGAALLKQLYKTEEADLSEHYAVEVASPGIGYRIKLPDELGIFIGERIRLVLAEGGERIGMIESLDAAGIRFADDADRYSLALEDIKDARTL